MRILFVTSGRIGDAVLSTGLLAHLAKRYPQARFTIACGPAVAPLFESAPFVLRVIPMVKRRRAGHWIDLWRATAFTFWSLVVDLRGSAIGWLVPAWRRRVLKSSWEPKHRLIHLAGALGLAQPQPPQLWITDDHRAAAARLIPKGTPFLALGPTANWPAKQWPAERFARLAAILTAPDGILPGAAVVAFGAEAERDSVRALLDGPVIDLVGKAPLPVVAACLERAALFIGNDSGLMHIAAAAGAPTLGLFGPSSEVFYGPWGAHCASVRGPRSFEDICWAPDFDHRSQDCMIADLEIERVAEAAADLWLRVRGHDPA